MYTKLSALTIGMALIVGAVACGEQETEAEREARMAAARADSMEMADSLYDPSAYDTLTWESPEARLERGGVVWRASCSRCHGSEGEGGGPMAEQMGIEVPSFMTPDWEYAGDIEAIRHRIFVGHEGMMPNWGLHGLKYRDVDAVAAFIDDEIGTEDE